MAAENEDDGHGKVLASPFSARETTVAARRVLARL